MSENRISDYFVVSGVAEKERHYENVYHPPLDPITDITVINRSNHEPVPRGFECVENTPQNHEANLCHGSIQGSKFFICFRRGRDKPPLLDIGVFHNDSNERLSPQCHIIKQTPSGFPANLNTVGTTRIYLTYRRSSKPTPYNQLVVTNICVILTSKNETPPHAFCLIEKNLNKGYLCMGSDAYLCYKKSMDRPPHLLYNPVILDRFPNEENNQYPLPQNLPLFCLPMGASIERWSKNDPHTPMLSTFILTTSTGTKIYGTLLNFYEEMNPETLSDDELIQLKFVEDVDPESIKKSREKNCIQRKKSICLLSQWPFFDQFKRFLNFIYHNFIETPSDVPVELYIFHFLKNIPFPSPDRPNIQVNLGPNHDDLMFSQTFEDFPIPSNGASFKKLLQNLGPDNCLYLLLFMLTEQKILLHSLRLSILTELAEALVAMIFPLNWNCPYIPLCPLSLAGVLNAPLPFIIGIYSQYFDYHEPPPDVISIDLDTKAIYLSETRRNLNLKLLPKKEMRILREKLEDIHERLENSFKVKERDSQNRKKFEKQIETELQEAFLYFMASILRDFQYFLKPITAAPKVGATDPSTLFDFEGFIQAHEANSNFYRQLTRTQMFTKFIEERSLVSDKNISLAFFDDCIEKVEKYENMNLKRIPKLNLINFEDRVKSSKTVFISIPSLISETDHQNPQIFDGHLRKDLMNRLGAKYLPNIGNSNSIPSNDFTDSSSTCFDSELQCYSFAKRAKHEVLKAQKIAQQSYRSRSEWAKCLLLNSYGLWFTHFPSFSYELSQIKIDNELDLRPINPLSIGYQVLQRMQTMDFSVPDEFCYRILMILCSIHSRPALAVKIFLNMRKYNVRLNAITYGYYNKAVIDGNWPTDYHQNARWIKLCNAIRVILLFQKHIKNPSINSLSCSNETVVCKKSFKLFSDKTNQDGQMVLTNSYCPSAGILWVPDRLKKSSSKNLSQTRKRHKSNDENVLVSKADLTRIANELLEIKNINSTENGDNSNRSNNGSSKETNSEPSIKEGSDDNNSEKNLFSNSFVSPLKDTFVNMDFIKSPVADKLRSSFRIAKNFTKSKYSSARSTLYDSEKNLNKVGSLFVKPDLKYKSSNDPNRTPPRMPRSSTLPQSFNSTPVNEIMNSKTQFVNYGISPSEYFYSTVKSIGGRINEFKLSLGTSSANSPVKFNVMNAVTSRLNFKNEEENINQSIDNLLDAFDENSFHMEKYQSFLNDYYSKTWDILQPKEDNQVVMSIEMISCTICKKCQSIIYDEEIMCKWFPDDSNLNTQCIHCDVKFVPSLTVYIKDYRNEIQGCLLDPISVPYLSPLVLRKEFENILNTESYSCLILPKFFDDHPIIYWNLVWYFTRLNLPSHIFGLALSASRLNSQETIKLNEKKGYNFKNVSITCMFDDEKFYDRLPLHREWLEIKNKKQGTLSSSKLDLKTFEELIDLIRERNLTKPIQFLISERIKIKRLQSENSTERLNSLYRELFFLNLMQQPPALDADSFDEEYQNAFESLTHKDKESLIPIDNPLPAAAIYCRNLFKPLSLIRRIYQSNNQN